MFMETSAKAGHNVKSLFKKIAMSLPGMEKEGQGDANTSASYATAAYTSTHFDFCRNRRYNASNRRGTRSLAVQLLIHDHAPLYAQCGPRRHVACFPACLLC